MNPDSKTYTVRSLVSQKAGTLPKPAYLLNQDAGRAITFNKAGNLFLFIYRYFWRKCPGRGMHEAILEDANKESGPGAGIDIVIPAIFFKQLIDNN
jgi:hypothetical protein